MFFEAWRVMGEAEKQVIMPIQFRPEQDIEKAVSETDAVNRGRWRQRLQHAAVFYRKD